MSRLDVTRAVAVIFLAGGAAADPAGGPVVIQTSGVDEWASRMSPRLTAGSFEG
jgi:hypothetical protein